MTIVENLQSIFSEAPSAAITSGRRRKLSPRPLAAGRTVIILGAAGVAVLGFLTGRLWIPAAAEISAAPAVAAPPAIPQTVSLSPGAVHNMALHIAPAQLDPVTRNLEVAGTVTFNKMHMAQVSAPARGRIEAVMVTPGQHVKAGERLAVLDYFDLGAMHSRVASAAAALAQAKAEDATAKAALDRAKAELDVGGIARSEVERRRAEAARTDATLRMRTADLQYQQEDEAHLMPLDAPGGHDGSVASAAPGPRNWRGAIVSPIDGDIDTVNVSPGEIADIGGAIVTVADLSNITVEANVPEGELGNLQEGDAITLHVDALPGRAFTGTIVHVADELDPHTGTDTVLCAVPNPDGALRVNMFGKVEIAEPLGRKAVQVADTAIQNVNGRPAIFVQVGKGKFAWRTVRTGSNSNGFTEIEQGLSPGTPIVTDGSYWLKAALLRSTIPDQG